jgi:hypothetical protein
VILAVIPNRIPYSTPAGPLIFNEDRSFFFNATGADPDPWHTRILDFRIVQLPVNGILQIGSTTLDTNWVTVQTFTNINTGNQTTHTLGYTPTLYWFGTDSFTFQFRDALGAVSNITNVTTTVSHINHPPTSSNLNITTFDLPVTFTLYGIDIDGNPLIFNIQSDISNFTGIEGTISLPV